MPMPVVAPLWYVPPFVPDMVSMVQHVPHMGYWELAQDAQGSRMLQTRLDEAEGDAERVEIAVALQGHVWEAIRCPNANHVIQKCVETLRPQALQFVIDEIFDQGPRAVQRTARQNFGCRILQRLLEHCSPNQLERIVEELLSEAVRLSVHQFGNYVMQCLAAHGLGAQRRRLTNDIIKDIAKVGSSLNGCAVLTRLLDHEPTEDLLALSNAVLANDGLVAKMGRMRHGHDAVEHISSIVAGHPDRKELLHQQLSAGVPSLQMSRYGRSIIAKFNLQPQE